MIRRTLTCVAMESLMPQDLHLRDRLLLLAFLRGLHIGPTRHSHNNASEMTAGDHEQRPFPALWDWGLQRFQLGEVCGRRNAEGEDSPVYAELRGWRGVEPCECAQRNRCG